MSRHRNFRDLDKVLQEAEDEYESEQIDYESLEPEQLAQLESGLQEVQRRIGQQTLVSDNEIRDALWDSYFDVNEALPYIQEQLTKRRAANARKDARRKQQSASGATTPNTLSRPNTRPTTPTNLSGPSSSTNKQLSHTQRQAQSSTLSNDVARLKLLSTEDDDSVAGSSMSTTPSITKERIMEEIRQAQAKPNTKPSLSLVVIGHVDAGKSTLMGRLLHDIGEINERQVVNNQRQSQRIGKGSFAYAWTFDALKEERERGVTIDVALDSFSTPNRKFTLIDAPGHQDFVPNMISGAAQADTALLVVDAAPSAFERGFSENGQTREHAILVRSLGVQQVVVAVNKLDLVDWSQERFELIKSSLLPYLLQCGFKQDKLAFVPCAAMSGVNVATKPQSQDQEQQKLSSWYPDGPTLLEQLDTLQVPPRSIESPLRIPVANVFRNATAVSGGSSSGVGVSGRVESGIVTLGERLMSLPGDGVGIVRAIEIDDESATYASAGDSVTLYLRGIDSSYINVGSVLCEEQRPISVASTLELQIVVFDLLGATPIFVGTTVELFHHSRDIPAKITKLIETIDKSSGQVVKKNPRMISKPTWAKIEITLKNIDENKQHVVPIEPFHVNKCMGRVLIRRDGETVAAGVVLSCS